jgi:hypothetical protein
MPRHDCCSNCVAGALGLDAAAARCCPTKRRWPPGNEGEPTTSRDFTLSAPRGNERKLVALTSSATSTVSSASSSHFLSILGTPSVICHRMWRRAKRGRRVGVALLTHRRRARFSFKDKEGKVRTEVRVRWWQEDLSTYRKAAIGPPADMQMIPDLPMPAEWLGHPYSGPPVLFGHYWFIGKPEVISPRFACLDYSAARDGPLVAYRWDGETELQTQKLACA